MYRIFFRLGLYCFLLFTFSIVLGGSQSSLGLVVSYCVHNSEGECTSLHEDQNTSFTILNANVGNFNFECRKYANNLCVTQIEENTRKNIQKLAPDIVVLQEVLAPWQCSNSVSDDSSKVCALYQRVPQVRRLVGDEYTIACDAQNQFECVAVKFTSGDIKECEGKPYCLSERTIANPANCDPGFTSSVVSIQMNNGFKFDLVNVHLQSTSQRCRVTTLNQLFDISEAHQVVQEKAVLVAGDFNFDPWRGHSISTFTWHQIMRQGWQGQKLTYHSEVGKSIIPRPTTFFLGLGRSVDFVVSNFAQGTLATLGETPNTLRLDSGFGTDHRALYGCLEYKYQETEEEHQ